MGKENLEEFAYRSIIRLILDNRFKPGDFLLETELAERLNLSRTPVRHALGQLVAEGFLDKKKKKGCYIPLPSAEDAKHVFFARESIERQTAASAAIYATDEDISELRALLGKEKQIVDSQNKEAYTSINEKLHLGIARMCKNRYLEQYCRHIFWRSNIYIFFFDNYYTQKDYGVQKFAPREHAKIVDAIENRNAEKSGNLMKQHVRFTFERLFLKL